VELGISIWLENKIGGILLMEVGNERMSERRKGFRVEGLYDNFFGKSGGNVKIMVKIKCGKCEIKSGKKIKKF
jgi:hypothetical protein